MQLKGPGQGRQVKWWRERGEERVEAGGIERIGGQRLLDGSSYCCFFFFKSSLKGLEMGGLSVVSIRDVTPIPHNGCRPKKARRL